MKKLAVMLLLSTSIVSLYGCQKSNNRSDTQTNQESASMTNASLTNDSLPEDNSDNTDQTYINNNPLFDSATLPYKGTEYSCDEFSFVIPEKYNDLVTVVVSDDGKYVIAYQTASYNIDGSGVIFCISAYDNPQYMVNEGKMLAYTPGKSYVLELPSDVPCYYQDEDILEEYQELCKMTDYIGYSLYVYSDDVNYHADEYILPASEYCKLSRDDLEYFDYNTLVLGRNEILAREGYDFESSSMDGAYYFYTYFSNTSWYQQNENVTEDDLNDIEKANLATLDAIIKEKSAEEPYCQMVSGDESITVDLDGDGVKETLSYTDAGPMDGKDLGFNPVITIDEDIYELWDYEQFGIPMVDVADHCFIFDLSPATPGFQLAVLDYGPSDDEVTYIYTFTEDSLVYCGSVPGFFLKPDTAISGLAYECIHTISRLDYVDTCWANASYYYDPSTNTLETYDSGLRKYKYANTHLLLTDVDMMLNLYDPDITYKVAAGSNVKIMGSDGSSYVMLKTDDGITGYLHLEYDDNYNLINPESGLTCDEIFDNRLLCD